MAIALIPARLFARLPRPLQRLLSAWRGRVVLGLTFLWRRLMVRTTVIAITGSVGKTTAKECLAAALATHGRILKTIHNRNDRYGVPRTIRAIRPWHRYAVVEVGTGKPGDIRRLARLLKPDVAVILSVARTHTNMFGSLENTAAEKAQLLSFLPRQGVALLNADDPRVAAMRPPAGVSTLFFGRQPSCHYRAGAVSASWPGRLTFELAAGTETYEVHTQLVGTHWLASVLAALAVADVCGAPLDGSIRNLARVPPFMGRMQPVALPGGAIVMRDEENGSPDTLDAMLDVLSGANANRRGLVFSDQSDSQKSPRKRLRDVGRAAARFCDMALFVGEHAHHGVRAATEAGMDAAHCESVVHLQEAAAWLRDSVRPGDLVFLKGRGTDHLSRILFAQFGEIGCWKTGCGITRLCDVCDQLQPAFDLKTALSKPITPDGNANAESHDT